MRHDSRYYTIIPVISFFVVSMNTQNQHVKPLVLSFVDNKQPLFYSFLIINWITI